ncbi:type III-A CRISPR-associated RAMP protein Csm3 [Methanotorris igneus]|uniref:CRISPR system Cms endoribonuclease Csm3 n=1 Tax=Methanotorris igneus (strain DSM 5666 / JCM 11834 / Kol 5) TaxID=880724 RepID=F6BET0_METIK|nr:type III-A CRISPR-associated RAMP protein Csm3 [Methanotorris igneus]AEF96877.1 CRISPR-associated RAMP protein, Csm3 family [Methanotorris igneus Kol 5]
MNKESYDKNRAFYGKIILKGNIKAVTGLHIGAQREVSEIGGIDNPVIKDPVTGLPYIPGSSLKGRLRSLLEIAVNSKQPKEKQGTGEEKFFNTKVHNIWIHVCKKYDHAIECEVCRLFGASGEENFPSRVIVRDSQLTEEWKKRFESGEVFTEAKVETAIDRITSAASPRQSERVPAGVEFEFEIIYNIEDENWKDDLKNLLSAMKMLEDSYLGGSGSRGYGKIKFKLKNPIFRSREFYFGKKEEEEIELDTEDIKELLDKFEEVFGKITI